MKSPAYDRKRDARILSAEAYPHDDEHLTLNLQYAEPSEGHPKYKVVRFLTDKLTARILADGLSLIFAIPDADEAWEQIAAEAAEGGSCDSDETVEKGALILMNPPKGELEAGQKAARDLVAHMKRMRAASTSFEILDGGTTWTVSVESKESGKPN